MQSYSYQSLEQEEQEEYKQELGLRKMLYKYQHENEQLKNQIKALTQRLQSIISKPKNDSIETQNARNASPKNKIEEAHSKYLNQQMGYYFKRIQQVNAEIKNYKDAIDGSKQIQFVHLTNTLRDKEAKLQNLKAKVQKFKVEEDQGQFVQENANVVNSNDQLEVKYSNQLTEIKKKIRQLEKVRNNNLKMDINRHVTMVNLETKTRKINSGELESIVVEQTQTGPVKKGLWGLDLTQENYRKILQDLEQLKKQKNVLLQSIKIQNNGLRQRLAKLKNQYIDLSSNSNINNSVNLSLNKLKQSSILTPKKEKKQLIHLPDLPVALGNSAYERKNDKNFVPKKIKLIEWNLNKNRKSLPGFSWNDENSKSPITGINLWLDKYLIGIQFIHTLGQTIQHLHSQGGGELKKLVPIQYRLNSNDYLENVVLVVSKSGGKQELPANSILGIELHSKNGRKDAFGLKTGSQGTQKFDFGIIGPQKPIYSFGSFIINSNTHLSSISSLGFAVI